MTTIRIMQANPSAQYRAYQTEIDAAIQRVLASGWYILGAEVEAFEREFAAYCETDYAIGLADGTNAAVVALRALGIGAGDEVITTGHTAVATVAAIELVGAIPVLVDIDASYCLDPAAVEQAITPQTKAITVVHLYGHLADLTALKALADAHNLYLIEDCAQAHGARWQGQRVGSIGHVGLFSFYPTKNLGAIGDGGAAVTSDPVLADEMRALRQYGWKERYISHLAGYNSRLDELQAAVLRVKLRGLDADNAKRRALAALYDELLAGSNILTPINQPDTEPVYHLYVVQVPEGERERIIEGLRAAGIGTGIHYPQPIHEQPAYAGRLRTLPQGLPNLSAATPRILSLPLYPELSVEDVRRVAGALLDLL